MIKSMTGYGAGEGRIGGVTYAVEIRTVNNRYFKASIRLPETVAFLEEDIERVLRKELSRGMVNYTLRLKDMPAEALFDINEKALRTVVRRLGKINASGGVEWELDVGGLLSLPGILTPALPDARTAGRITRKVLAVTRRALRGLKSMRAAEGAALAADLGRHCKAIERNLATVCSRNKGGPKEYAEKLIKRIDELLATAKLQLNDETVAREVAIFTDRSDISEETARLDSHLRQFEKTVGTDDQAGRKLDFICQEMLREANTIASKALDADVVHRVVDIKCLIERIKEQVQNVE
jgi:uncharacterized protein (TIGR00255 family)